MVSLLPATRADLPTITALLTEARLPLAGLDQWPDQWLDQIVVARQDGQIIGCAAFERYGEVALLRSVAVTTSLRGRQVGRRLVEAVIARAHAQGVTTLYLLTETAADFFARLNFQPVARAAVAPAIQHSVEWTEACPVSAQALYRSLRL